MSFSDFPVFRTQHCRCLLPSTNAPHKLPCPSKAFTRFTPAKRSSVPPGSHRRSPICLSAAQKRSAAFQHIKSKGTRTAGLPTPTGAHQVFLHPRRAVPRNPRPKTKTWAFPKLRPGFFHPGSTHRLRTYRALIPLEIGNASPRPPSSPAVTIYTQVDRPASEV
jgi:hypothetical protein